MAAAMSGDQVDMALVRSQWPPQSDRSLYFNTGSCGRKPRWVLEALAAGWAEFNDNPTYYTFYHEGWSGAVRDAASQLLEVLPERLLLTQNSTQGLQLVLSSFLNDPEDQLLTTTHEHGSVNTIGRYLEETRGIVVRNYEVEPLAGSQKLCQDMLSLITKKTRLVAISEIDCYSGWRPNLSTLVEGCRREGIPLLVDGAHSLGQGLSRPVDYPFWVTSGHKWLGGPNGTGFVYAQPEWAERLKPTWLSDRMYNEYPDPLMRFDFQGTADAVRWKGLAAAFALFQQLGPKNVAARQRELSGELRKRLMALPGSFLRTPDIEGETSGMLTVTWERERLAVANLKEHLWDTHRIWTQPDFCYGDQGSGLRLSCHVSIEDKDIDRLIDAIALVVR